MTPRRNSGRGRWLAKLPKISGFPFNITATVEAGDYTFGMQLEFPKKKMGVALG